MKLCLGAFKWTMFVTKLILMCSLTLVRPILEYACVFWSPYMLVKALPRVCMKNTARGESSAVAIYHETPDAVFHTHKHRQCFKWYIVLDHSQLIHVVVL